MMHSFRTTTTKDTRVLTLENLLIVEDHRITGVQSEILLVN